MNTDIMAEKAIIGACLLDSSMAKQLNLSVDDFTTECKDAWESIQSLIGKGVVIDLLTVARELYKKDSNVKPSMLGEYVSSVAIASHAPHYADILKQCSMSRMLVKAGEQITDFGYANKEDSLEKAQKVVNEMSRQLPKDRIYTPREIAEQAEKRYNELTKVGAGLSTYLERLDGLTGGIHKGSYWLLAARTSVGKTTLGLQLATDIAQTNPVLFISLEMLLDSITDKRIAGISGKPARLVMKGNYSEDTLDKITLALGEIADTQLYVTEGVATTLQIRRYIEKFIASYGEPACIFIDYLQLVADQGKSRYEVVTNISRELSNMAKEYKIPIIALSQLSRGTEVRSNKRPELQDLRESGALEQDADIIIFLYRSSYYTRNMEDDSAEIIVAKNRLSGSTGSINMRYDRGKERYYEE